MKKFALILLTVLTVVAVAVTAAGCDLLDKILNKINVDNILETLESLVPEGFETGDNLTVDVTTEVSDEVQTFADGELSIHFLELGNKYTGDCTLIKIGNVEVLIDAGSRTSSSATIVPYIRQYCTDGKLEYVIATHAHQDHIAGFVGSNKNPGVFDSFEIGTIIEFALTNATSTVYSNYCSERDEAVSRGATKYTALQCYNNSSGARRTYTLAEGVTMEILYNYFYDHNTDDENNYSVCMLLTQGTNHYLFTGDLEKEGEEKLVQNNSLPHVQLFKGGHHGSYTANTTTLMKVIQPEMVCVCCCCGTTEYTSNDANTFPSQAFFDHVLPYTERIYVTTICTDFENGVYSSLNGNIVVTSMGSDLKVTCSASATPVTETAWFSEHRKRQSN
ncbi:MAG: MBL fold metallo-hydrolase [Clostridia bacterium]|nr:MBL fold metallo-hydrolase [Clostridia bacterium]